MNRTEVNKVKRCIASNLFCKCSAKGANINLINEPCLEIRVVRDAKCHMITTETMVPSLSLSVSHTHTHTHTHCGIVGDRLPCSDARSQAAVFGRNQ